jgi:uncharacterized membrane protein
MMTKLMCGFLGSVAMMPVVAQIPADTAMEKLGKGTTQVVLAVVVIALALALIQIFRLHREDAATSRKELKDEMEKSACQMFAQMEKSQQIISENTSAMNMMAKSNEQLKEAIFHLSHIIDKKLG